MLSRGEWLQLPAGQRGGWSYDKYKNWVVKTRNIRAQKRAVAPYQATMPSTTVAYTPPPAGYRYTPYKPVDHTNDVISGFMPTPEPQLRSQAQSFVNDSVNPVLDQIKASFAARDKAGAGQINKYSSDLAASLAPLAGAFDNVYQGAEAQQKAIDSGLGSFIKDQAAALGGATGASIQDPAAAAQAKSLTDALGAGAAITNAADTSASLSQLNADKATMHTFAGLQPGLAQQYGLGQLADFERGLSQQQGDAVGQVTQQVPGMISSMYQSLLDRELQKATGRQNIISDRSNQDLSAYSANQQGREQAANDAFNRWQAGYGMASDNADRALTAWTTLQNLTGIDPNVSAGLGYPADSHGYGDPTATFTDPSAAGSKGNPYSQERIDTVMSAATKRALGMSTRATKDALGQSTPNPVPNQNAYPVVFAYFDNAFPNAPLEWKLQQTQAALVKGGYRKAADPKDWGNFVRRLTSNPTSPKAAGNAAANAAAGQLTPPAAAPQVTSEHGQTTPTKPTKPTKTPKQQSSQDQADRVKASHIADYAVNAKVAMREGRGGMKYRTMTPTEAYEMARTKIKQSFPHMDDGTVNAIAWSAVQRMR